MPEQIAGTDCRNAIDKTAGFYYHCVMKLISGFCSADRFRRGTMITILCSFFVALALSETVFAEDGDVAGKSHGGSFLPDAAIYFYSPSRLEKILNELAGLSMKALEALLPDAAGAAAVLDKLQALLKDGAGEKIKAFGAALEITDPAAMNFKVYLAVLAVDAAAADEILASLSGGAAPGPEGKLPAGKGLTGLVYPGNIVVLTPGEKKEGGSTYAAGQALAAEFFARETAAPGAAAEKLVFYRTPFTLSLAIDYINKNYLSLLDRAVEKLDGIALGVIDDDNCEIDLRFTDPAALAAHYEVIVGYKETFGCFMRASGRMKAAGGPDENMNALASDLGPLVDKIGFKIKDATLTFTVPELKKYVELKKKLERNAASSVSGGEAARGEAPEKACAANRMTIEGAAELYLMENTGIEKPIDIETLVREKYLKKVPQCPDGGSYTLDCGGDPKGSYKAGCGRHKER